MEAELVEIIKKAKKGDKKSMGILVMNYQKQAFSLAFRIVGDDEDARDIVQDSFIKIWQNISKFDEKMKFSTWMYRIVTNMAIDYLRKVRKNKMVDVEKVESLIHKAGEDPEAKLSNIETGNLIRVTCDSLSPKQRIVYALRELHDMGTEETAEILGMTIDSVKSNLYHARKYVRKKMQNLLNTERGER